MTVLLESVVSDGVTPELADEVEVEMGIRENPPVGLVVHTRLVRRGQWHLVDVWDSVEAYEAFVRDRLAPASQRVIERRGITLNRTESQRPRTADVDRGGLQRCGWKGGSERLSPTLVRPAADHSSDCHPSASPFGPHTRFTTPPNCPQLGE